MNTPTSINSLVFQDGFDYYNNVLTKWTGNTANITFQTPGRFGYGQCLNVLSPYLNSTLYKAVQGAPYTRYVVGMAFYYTESSTNYANMFGIIDNQANILNAVYVGPLGTISFNGNVGTNYNSGQIYNGVTSSPNAFNVQAWNYIELDVILSATSGSFTIRLNSEPILTQSNIQTSQNTNPAYGIYLSAANHQILFDDIYVLAPSSQTLNDSFLGDIKIIPLIPNGVGQSSQFTQTGGTAGQHYTSINEVPPDGDTSYLSSNTPGQIDMSTLPTPNSLTPTSAIFGVSAYAYSRKDDSPSRFLSVGVGNGTTQSFDSGSALGSTYTYVQRVMPINPLTNAPWVLNDFNNLQVGIKLIS